VREPVDLSILIVSYNTRDLTIQSLRTLIEHSSDVRCETIVIDNASSDGSAAAIEATFPSVRLIRLEENVGFAAANNIAAKHACGEKLLLLNPDTITLNGAVRSLLEFSERRPEAGIWGGRTYLDERLEALNPGSCWGLPTLWSLFCETLGLNAIFSDSLLFNSEHYGSWLRDEEREVGMVSGCFLLISRPLWNRLGGFDTRFFMYFEDTDLNIRARQLGYRPAITPEATIIHFGGASEPDQAEKLERFFQSKARLIRCHWSRGSARIGMALLMLRPLVRSIAYQLAGWSNPTRFGGQARTWRTVWRRRQTWMNV